MACVAINFKTLYDRENAALLLLKIKLHLIFYEAWYKYGPCGKSRKRDSNNKTKHV